MLINAQNLVDFPVLSLHTGTPIAKVSQVIIDPDQLKIIAFYIEPLVNLGDAGNILLIDSIREVSHLGLIVDSSDEFASDGEVVRVDNVTKLHFEIVGLNVVTKKKAKLGKVSGYVVESKAWQIQQLIVERPFFKAIFDPELVISRREIVEVYDDHIVVKEEKSKTQKPATITAPLATNFVNPFRDPEFAGGGEAEATKDIATNQIHHQE